jgi:hypothetical protein
MRQGAWIKLPGGGTAHVTFSGVRRAKCQFCRNEATLECDYPVGQTLGGEPITCDAKMCASCARPVGADRDHCPDHSMHATRKTIRNPLTRKELDRLGYKWVGVGECRGCAARIEWWETPNKRPDGSVAKMPMTVREDDRLVNHWSVCPTRAQFRQANKQHAARAGVKKPEQGALNF